MLKKERCVSITSRVKLEYVRRARSLSTRTTETRLHVVLAFPDVQYQLNLNS